MSLHCNNEVPVKIIPSEPRIAMIESIFKDEFSCKPCFYVRVPGRVNLIGEHIDYCGYPVLPMALEQDILMAVGTTNEKELLMKNNSDRYENFHYKFKNFENIEIVPDANGKPFWYNYVLCGVKGALEYLENKVTKGLQIIVDGNIPPASGLSSSSALVSASCLAFLFAQGVRIEKSEIASLCAKSERYIGTQGGGMDQAIAFLGEKHCAQYITWNPLKATPVTLPEQATFVVAHSLAEANKAATNDFNQRVMECRLAAKILGHVLGASLDSKIITLSQVQAVLGKSLLEMTELVLTYLPQAHYSKEKICDILNISPQELDDLYLTPNTRHITEFKLQQRALHVYEEAMRVEKFREVCLQNTRRTKTLNGTNGVNENGGGDSDILEILGSLMSESHQSLKQLYECSHKNLDKLVELSQDMNVHCRLTGAGWGGCAVALCPISKASEYIDKLKNDFYKLHCSIEDSSTDLYVFATTPNHGAAIYSADVNVKYNAN